MLCIIRYAAINCKETLLTTRAKLRLRGNCGRKSSKKVFDVIIA